MTRRAAGARVAATDDVLEPDGRRWPAGEVHGWLPGSNGTVCGLSLSRSRLRTFAGVAWADAQPASGGYAEHVQAVCPRCRAGVEGRTAGRRTWVREDPRP